VKISWHLLFDHLSGHPELVDEDLRTDVATLTESTDTLDSQKETDILQRLQRQLGNQRLQRLLTAAQRDHAPDKGGMSATKTSAPATEPGPASTLVPINETPASTLERTTPQDTVEHNTPIETAKEPVMSEPVGMESAPPQTGPEVESRPGSTARATLIKRVLESLPLMHKSLWVALSELFDTLDDAQQRQVITRLIDAINMLDDAHYATLLAEIERLPPWLRKTSLLAALLIRLRPPISPVPEPAPAPPEEEE